MRPEESRLAGPLYGISAFVMWGAFPIYFTALLVIPPIELTAIRIIATGLSGFVLLFLLGRMDRARPIFAAPKVLAVLFVTGWLNTINWGAFVYGTHTGQVLQISLGYFLVPLVNVTLGLLVLRERLRPFQIAAVVLAAIGVIHQVGLVGTVPWISIVLGLSFGFYGLTRKMLGVDPLAGLAIEHTLLLPFMIGSLVWISAAGGLASSGADWGILLLLAGSGFVGAAPLICYNEAARRMPISALGLMNYLAPCLQFLVAILLYDERFGVSYLITFGFIWAALVFYSIDLVRGYGRSPQQAAKKAARETAQ